MKDFIEDNFLVLLLICTFGAFFIAMAGIGVAHHFGYKSGWDKDVDACQPYKNLPVNKQPAKCAFLYQK